MVKEGIIKKINEYYPNCTITGDRTKEDLEEPYFFVHQLPKIKKSELQSSVYDTDFDIQYYLSEEEDDLDIKYAQVGDKLLDILEIISISDNKLIRGLNMRWEVIDNVLHVFVTYKYGILNIPDTEKMKSLEVEEGVKEYG